MFKKLPLCWWVDWFTHSHRICGASVRSHFPCSEPHTQTSPWFSWSFCSRGRWQSKGIYKEHQKVSGGNWCYGEGKQGHEVAMGLMGGVSFRSGLQGECKPGMGRSWCCIHPGKNFPGGGTGHCKDPPVGQRCLWDREGHWDWGLGTGTSQSLGGPTVWGLTSHSKELGLYSK